MAKKITNKTGMGNGSAALATPSSGFSSGGSGAAVATAPAAKPSPATTAPASPKPTVTRDQIAKRAYEIWVAKGRPHGKDLENWQQAERELRVR